MTGDAREHDRNANSNADWTPRPDPTLLTTQQLLRELSALDEKLTVRIGGMFSSIEQRLNAMDKATILLNDNVTRVPTAVDKEISHLRELHDEKFSSIDKQFAERDVRVEQTARDTKVAVDAALQAAKEATGEANKAFALSIAKSEAATSKNIDQQGTLIASSTAALDSKITDVKDRLTRLESGALGRNSGFKDIWGYIIGGFGAVVLAVSWLTHVFQSTPVK